MGPRISGIVQRMNDPILTQRAALAAVVQRIGEVIIGKQPVLEQALVCLLAGGHLLIEDIPGVGKTTLAQALSRSLGLQFSRVQFTADLMPSDLLGISLYDRHQDRFTFRPGPVFAQVLLADEINRSGPKTQSALLEAMEERQVSVDGQTHPLPQPFFVIATQNALHQIGTHPLPESQLDRFLMCLSLGYPDARSERALLQGQDRRSLLARLEPVLNAEGLAQAQAVAQGLHVSEALLDYLQALIAASRSGQWFVEGLSPRAALALLRAAKAQALLRGRSHVAPEDVQEVFVACTAHRLTPVAGSGRGRREQVQAMLQGVALP